MTKDEKYELANIVANMVIERIKIFQEELDQKFHEDIVKLERTQTVTLLPLVQETLDDAHKALLEQLEQNLKIAVSLENYELAAKLQKEIDELKG